MTHRRAGRTAAACRDAARRGSNRPVLSTPPRRGDARSSRPRGGAGRRAEQLVHLGAQEPVVRVRGRGLADRREALSRRRPALPEPAHLRVERGEPRRERRGLVRAGPRLALRPRRTTRARRTSGPTRRDRPARPRPSADPPTRTGAPTRAAREAGRRPSPRRFTTSPPPTAKPCSTRPEGSESSNAPRSGSSARPERDDDVPRPGLPLGDPAARHEHRAVEPRERRARAPAPTSSAAATRATTRPVTSRPPDRTRWFTDPARRASSSPWSPPRFHDSVAANSSSTSKSWSKSRATKSCGCIRVMS